MRKETSTAWAPLEEAVPAALLKAEVVSLARQVGVEPKEIHVRTMARKWASCSSVGRLTFDVGLLSRPASFRRAVILHELLHLKVPNHGKLFRALVRAHLTKTGLSEADVESGESIGANRLMSVDGATTRICEDIAMRRRS